MNGRGGAGFCWQHSTHTTHTIYSVPPRTYVDALVTAQKKTRVVVGMSGGVDSSATAALLLQQDYDVIGITLKLWPQDCVSRAKNECCEPQGVTDARAACHKLGIPYYLVDEAGEFRAKVIQYFADCGQEPRYRRRRFGPRGRRIHRKFLLLRTSISIVRCSFTMLYHALASIL
jgi:hypothetical protein